MNTRNLLILAVLLALASSSGCSLDPEPEPTRMVSRVGATVTLRGEELPADEVYWTFYSYPTVSIVNLVALSPETATFEPQVTGEYIVDRWAVSGPAGIWLDRFVVEVNEAPPWANPRETSEQEPEDATVTEADE